MKNPPRKMLKEEPDDDPSEMQAARGRLKGLLTNLATGSEEEQEHPIDLKPQRGRPRKKQSAKSYTMKLFDRTVNVGRFDLNSPLYPICRAWLYDQQKPCKKVDTEYKRTYYEGREPLIKALQRRRMDRVVCLPRPAAIDVSRIPTPLKRVGKGIHDFDLDYDLDDPPCSRKDIMNQHRQRWTKVRDSWIQQIHKYEERYEESFEVLDSLAKY